MEKVCWLGLGRMGLPMASNLRSAGFEVHGFDPSPAARQAAESNGIATHDTALTAVSGAAAVLTMLPTYAHVRDVLASPGLLAATAEDALVIDSSTISSDDARRLHDVVESEGRRFLDAPVSGGTPGAEAGTLTFMVGGTDTAVEVARPFLAAMGSRIFHLGATGCGQSAKTVNNMMLAMNMASVCEAAILAERLGLDHQNLMEVLKVSTSDSWVLRNFYPVAGVVEKSPANNDFAPGFTAQLMRKDVGLALAAAEQYPVDLGMTAEIARRLDRLIDEGLGDQDFSVLVKLAGGLVGRMVQGVVS